MSVSRAQRGDTRAYLVGGGIASLASAAYLIRDGCMPGENICILEASPLLGGSLDGGGSAENGYVIRGGRMLTYEAYTCTFDLLSFIPSLANPADTVATEIRAFNTRHVPNSQARLVKNGARVDASDLGLSVRDRVDLLEILATSEERLGTRRIVELFQASFFQTHFWLMWATTFAFQPWHSAVELRRYLLRFLQEFPRIHTLGGVRRTPYNQYDSIVRPLTQWLRDLGVRFEMDARVTDLDFKHGPGGRSVDIIRYVREGAPQEIQVGADDLVFVTIGSMTAASSFGSMQLPPRPQTQDADGSWALWDTLARKHPDFGRPAAFHSRPEESQWLSFTVTQRDPLFFQLMEAFSGNEAGTGGLVTLMDSNWLMSIVLAHQPHFIGQPAAVKVFWGYGLFVEKEGNFVKKKMSECSGTELLRELLGHLRFEAHSEQILATSNCIPCLMPFITSQFMPRAAGDRPAVCPAETTRFALIGQFCEIPDDVVFTVEYSVRAAQTAVYGLLGLDKQVSPLYKGQYDIGVDFNALRTLLL